METRDFVIEDHRNVFQVAREAWIFAYSPHYSIEAIDNRLGDWYSIENHERMVRRQLLKELYFKVCLLDGEIEGFIAGDFLSSTLLRLYIRPTHTRTGIGNMLLSGYLKEIRMRDSEKCTTFCDKLNTVGLGFYKKQGFMFVGEDSEDYKLEKYLVSLDR